MRELRRRWRAAERRIILALPGSPEWDAARAQSEELEAAYMGRLNRILEWSRRAQQRPASSAAGREVARRRDAANAHRGRRRAS